jgi:hypothetical protein
MKKLKDFLKKYWIWLLVGALLGIIILVVVLLNRQKEEEIILDLPVEPITNPYIQTDESPDITMDIIPENFQEKEWVYSVTRPDTILFTNFVQNFYELEQEDINMEEETILTKGDDLIWYNSDTGILSLYSKGLVLDLKITTARDISPFFTQYFGIRTAVNEKTEPTERGILYSGYFEYQGERIGSSNLDGYAYKLELDKDGRLIEFSMLLLKEENLQKYQFMPTTQLNQLISTGNPPMKIVNLTIEDRFYNQPDLVKGSVRLTTLSANEVQNLFLLNNFEDKYILPTYKISGDGRLVDSRGEEYWSVSEVFVCAINPEYLLEKPEETFREQPHTQPSSFD